ncbi:MAG TPA: hypothetical protein VFX47_02945 [Gammaproteobacteria bacterium]|nr:hypothetical protein [Gammaproteobacteria bacterium]
MAGTGSTTDTGFSFGDFANGLGSLTLQAAAHRFGLDQEQPLDGAPASNTGVAGNQTGGAAPAANLPASMKSPWLYVGIGSAALLAVALLLKVMR